MSTSDECVTIKLKDHAFGVDLHPTRKLLAAGLISGQLKLFDFDAASAKQMSSAKPHDGSCRAARFSTDGSSVFTCGSDASLQQRDVDGKPVVFKEVEFGAGALGLHLAVRNGRIVVENRAPNSAASRRELQEILMQVRPHAGTLAGSLFGSLSVAPFPRPAARSP